MSHADPASSYRAIESLIAAYTEMVDDGDFTGVAEGHCEGMAPTIFWDAAYNWLDTLLTR